MAPQFENKLAKRKQRAIKDVAGRLSIRGCNIATLFERTAHVKKHFYLSMCVYCSEGGLCAPPLVTLVCKSFPFLYF